MPTGYNLTADERVGYEFDLTHGHPYRTPFPAELEAIEERARFSQGPTSIREAKEAESEFIDAFMGMSGQEVQPNEAHFVFPSASQSLVAASMMFADSLIPKNGSVLTAYFLSPVFDNVSGLFQRHGFRASSIREEPNFWRPHHLRGAGPGFEESISRADLFVLVTPNNPTGFRVEAEGLKSIAATCAANGTALCIDRTFLNQPEGYAYNMHKILASSGVSYAVIDDTGKLWATQEDKLSILTVSKDLSKAADEVHNTLQLCASTASMKAFANLCRQGGALSEIRQLIARNRSALWEAGANTEVFESVASQDPPSDLSVETIRLRDYDPVSVMQELGKLGVGVLTLVGFLPDTPEYARLFNGFLPRLRCIRTSLSRDPSYIEGAAERIARLNPDNCAPVIDRTSLGWQAPLLLR